jgi:hypothetical protein
LIGARGIVGWPVEISGVPFAGMGMKIEVLRLWPLKAAA